MSTESRKESKLFLRSKETTAGTADTFDFYEATSCVMTKPPTVVLQESDLGKLGRGEFGTKAEMQAVYSTFSVKCSRLSEFLYFMSFFQGKEDSMRVVDVPNSIFSHELDHLDVTSRTLPTFTMIYKDGLQEHLCTHCIITDFTFTLAAGGNGVIDATFNGVCNMHASSSGTIYKQTLSTAWSSGAYSTVMAAESLINYKGSCFYMGSATEAVPLVHASVAYGASDLASSETISPYVNSITITGNNGFSGEDAIRACGDGILNNQERKEYVYTCEIQVRKDDTLPATSFDAMLIADSQRAIEIDWQGKLIQDAYRYALDIFLPVVQLTNVTEDDESPINQTLTFSVFGDSQRNAFQVFGQNKVGIRMNASHGSSGEASTSQSATMSSTSMGISSSSST